MKAVLGNVLFVSPAFFGYERDITAALEARGYAVDFVDERPSNNTVERAVLRVRKSLVGPRISRYYEHTLQRLKKKKFDIVLVIKGEVVPRFFLESVRAANPNARFVFYTFDALSNSPQCLKILDLFNECYSFDRHEVDQHAHFAYKPLFYTSDFKPPAPGQVPHDISFVGTLHSDRYATVKRAFGSFQSSYGFFYVQAPWYFAYGKYVTKEFANVVADDVSFDKMSKAGVAEVFRNSRAVMDIQRSGQSGLTMRTFEVLASGSILITTNEAVKQEPFYDPSRIIVLPADEADWDFDWIASRVASHDPSQGAPQGFEQHSLANWLDEFLHARVPRESGIEGLRIARSG